jgi:staphylococcal nuclease domain-containing protein 1
MMQQNLGANSWADLSGMPAGLMAPNPAMAMAANAIVTGGQQQQQQQPQQQQQQQPPQPSQPQPQFLRRVVKWVFSGDYLVLRDYPRGGPPPEYYINLAYVQAPRFNRTPGEDGKTSVSEPYAWEAKEYLAKRLIGREVIYVSEYTKSGGAQPNAAGGPFGSNANKEFGIIYLGEENIVKTMVSEGLLEVRRAKTESPMLQQLIEAEEEAKQAGRGRFSSQPAPKHELLHEHPNPSSLKGKSFDGTVENVRNGGAIQVYLDLGVEQGVHKHLNASIMVTGIRSPDKNRPNESKFFDEAKFFTESRLLNREVKVHIEKVERNSYLASVVLGQNNLAEALLRQGMARCNDASITLTKAPEKLRAAEKEAKSKRLRIWENYVDSRGDGPAETYEAKIVEIISGDSMMAQNLATGEVKKIFLASIRLGAPADREKQRDAAKDESATTETTKTSKSEKTKSGTAQQATTEPAKTSSIPRIYDNPILYHAREMLRKKLLGKKALVKVEYVQPKSDSYPEKICCTVRPADQPKWNAAEALVGKGYASVVKYVSDDSQRASNFDELLKIEQNAVKTKDSKEKQKELAPLKVVDLCNDATRAKQLFPFLSRTRKDAVIEFVFSASRFKVFLPKENNTLLNLVLAGVMVPREPEALKNASTAVAKSLVHQRDVTIQIDSMDKKGNFIGWIYYKDEQTNKETSINLALVKLGYGQVRDSSASGTLGELKAAESVAREKKLGLWLTYQEPKRREEEVSVVQDDTDGGDEENAGATTNGVSTANKTANKEAELLKNRKPVVVTNAQMKEKNVIVSVQAVESGPKLEELLHQMRSELPQAGKKGGSGEGYTPTQKGEIVAAKFSADRQWYRAKVLKVNSPQDIEILFIDYGNVEKTKAKDLAKLASKYATQEAYAKDYTLAFVEATTHDLDWVEESRRAFLELSFGQVLMRVEYNDPTTKLDAVTLVNESTKIDIGKKLVEDGLLIAMKRRERKFVRTINEYINAEKLAKEKRLNMWQYGDFTADDAREFGFRSAAA